RVSFMERGQEMDEKDDFITLSALADKIVVPGADLRAEVARLLEEDAKLMTRIVQLLERIQPHAQILPSDTALELHSLALLARASRGLKKLLSQRLRYPLQSKAARP